MEGVGILRLMKLVKVTQHEMCWYQVKLVKKQILQILYLLNSIIQTNRNMTNLATMESKNILNNKMDDINEFSNIHSYLKYFNNNIRNFGNIKHKMRI